MTRRRGPSLDLVFDAVEYVREHGKEPRGRGSWVFLWDGCHYSAPAGASLTQAKAHVRRAMIQAGAFGLHLVRVCP